MISTDVRENCCGCEGCSQICPKQCITMTADDEGFSYPVIDTDVCVECGLCETVCPIVQTKEINTESENYDAEKNPTAYGVRHRDDTVRADSSSGGAFTLIAEYVLDNNGKVYGCRLDENMHAIHVGIDSKEDLHLLRGSKYVQSEIGHVYAEIRENLKQDKWVLFVGTPCQAAGLYFFLRGEKYEKLIITDFICHGVPSPAVFKDFILKEQSMADSKMTGHYFRTKDHGWNQTGLQLGTISEYGNGFIKRRYPAFKDSFMNGFLDNIYLRPSCYDCRFKTLPKYYADYTIADFWGVNKVNPELNDHKGTSLLLIHSSKGNDIWNAVRDNSLYEPVDFEKAAAGNRSLTDSVKMNKRRAKFYDDYRSRGYRYVEKKYMSASKWALHKGFNILMKYLKRLEQFIKFSIVGCSNTIISLGVYYLLIFLKVHYLVAYSAGFIASVCNAFYWNNKYVFKNKQETSIVKAFIKVFASYGFSFVLSVLLISLMVEIIGIPSVIAPILKMAVTIPLNFMLNKVWAFKDRHR